MAKNNGLAQAAAAAKAFCAALALLAAVMVARAVQVEDMQASIAPCRESDDDYIAARGNASQRLAEAVRFQTISYAPGQLSRDELVRLREFLVRQFPLVHERLEWEVVGNYSLLYHWKGSSPELKPYMLASHLDVVPVDKPETWTEPPFAGNIRDGYIWGRGTMDDKMGVMAILEVFEFLLARDWKPARSIYAGFGHDEEVGGKEGAGAISAALQARGVSLSFLVDEGMPIVDGMIPGIQQPVALIGTSEKGWATVELTVEREGGHASMPPSESAIGILSNAIARLEANPMPSRFGTGPERRMFEFIARYMAPPLRFVMANLWLLSPVVTRILATKPNTNAAIRTTTAVTVMNAGFKTNALPSTAKATVNHRIHPADSVEAVLTHDERVINDPRVRIRLVDGFEPAPVSSDDPEHGPYRAMQRTIRQVFPDALVSPALFIANSDTRHYWNLTDSIYRFIPAVFVSRDLSRIHGTDERMSVEAYGKILNYYYHLVRNADLIGVDEPPPHEHEEL